MRNILKKFAVILIAITILFVSCKKDDNNSNTNPPTDVVGTTISGIVFNTNHIPISGVEVVVGNKTQTTGVDGSFLFENTVISNDRYKVEFNKDGYFETYRAGKSVSNGVTKVEVSMVAIDVAEATTYTLNFNASDGGVLFGATDTLLYFPPNLHFVQENGTTYTGSIDVYAKYVDASLPEYSKVVPGGDQFGKIDDSNYYLNSFSGVMVALFDSNGDRIDLVADENNTAQVHIQIPISMQANAPDFIDSWYNGGDLAYATNKGSEEKRDGTKYTASVGHFSLWSMQTKFSDFGTIKGRISDCNGDPVNGVRVQVGQSYAITNNDGIYSRILPAGVDNILVQVLAEDYYGNTSAPVIENALASGEIRSDVDIQLACVGTITGRLVNCSGNPIPGQVVVTNGQGSVSKTYTNNGYFELKFDQNVTSFEINCKGNNYSTQVLVNNASFPYNAGDISLCQSVEPPPTESNTVVIDGVTYTNFNEGSEGFITTENDVSNLYLQGQGEGQGQGNNQIFLILSGCDGVGEWPIIAQGIGISKITIDGTTYHFQPNATATVTTFEDVGGRIIGTFSGISTNEEAISGTFNMERTANGS